MCSGSEKMPKSFFKRIIDALLLATIFHIGNFRVEMRKLRDGCNGWMEVIEKVFEECVARISFQL
jgi:hypothetical protein